MENKAAAAAAAASGPRSEGRAGLVEFSASSTSHEGVDEKDFTRMQEGEATEEEEEEKERNQACACRWRMSRSGL